ncbi:MAG: inner membrane CreD family protein [Alphaproteobacteria bacterium]|nr:inner membrane CreD family protein [Alphaproteobacteria bacterium]MCW5741659.1 inner membrane CreD family protein [Alphaproteobacteria bacterium]
MTDRTAGPTASTGDLPRPLPPPQVRTTREIIAAWPSSVKLGLKMTLLAALALCYGLPLGLIADTVNDRSRLLASARAEITSSWGHAQTLLGPLLLVPHDSVRGRDEALILPDQLGIEVALQPQIRHRGMFEAVVYTSEVKLSGRFRWQEREGDGIGAITRLRFGGARLMLAAGDLRALRISSATIDGVPLSFEPATRGPDMAAGRQRKAAIDAAIAGLDAARLADGVRFEIAFTLNGSERIAFEPAGNLTAVKVSAPWPDPGFFGPFRPVEQRIGDDGFNARWQVSILGRGFGNAGTSADGSSTTLIKRLADSAFGVNLVQPVTPYRGVDRMLKYGLLTVGIVFALYLAFEIAGRSRLHPVQYALSGAAMALFPLLLLSVGEHTGFVAAYALAAAGVVALTAWYTWHATRQRRFTVLFASASAALFAYLYLLLQAENWSLLGGSLALFVALTGLMYATRNIGRSST